MDPPPPLSGPQIKNLAEIFAKKVKKMILDLQFDKIQPGSCSEKFYDHVMITL